MLTQNILYHQEKATTTTKIENNFHLAVGVVDGFRF